MEKLLSGYSLPRASVYSYQNHHQSDGGTGGVQDFGDATGDPNPVDESVENTRNDAIVTETTRQNSVSLQIFFAQPVSSSLRARDVLASLLGLILLSPLLFVLGVAVKATSGGPVLFRQQRTGLAGKPFTILKLRTMRVGAEEQKAALLSQSEQDGPASKMAQDPRISSIGGFCVESVSMNCHNFGMFFGVT